MKKILLLGLGDDYWAKFIYEIGEILEKENLEFIVALESKLGEYQTFGFCKISERWKTYYLTEFVDDSSNNQKNYIKTLDPETLFSDYFRLYQLNSRSKLASINWDLLQKSMESFFIQLFSTEKIGIILHDQVSTIFSSICWHMSCKYNISYWGLVGARIAGHYEIRKTIYEEHKKISHLYMEILEHKNPLTTEEKRWASRYITNIENETPSYMKNNALNITTLSSYINRNKLFSFGRKIKYLLKEKNDVKNLLVRDNPVIASLKSLHRNIRRLLNKRLIIKYQDNLDENWYLSNSYYLYPIHYQPEASTSIGSPHFVDQEIFIRNVAFSLPPNTWLVVKDHISSEGYFSIDFYKNIFTLPNVKFVNAGLNSKKIIKNSQGVITLTSTVGFEAILLKKNVFIFGNASYQFHKLCQTVHSWYDLKYLLRKNNNVNKTNENTDDGIAFLCAYKRYTKKGTIDYKSYAWGIGCDLATQLRIHLESAP